MGHPLHGSSPHTVNTVHSDRSLRPKTFLFDEIWAYIVYKNSTRQLCLSCRARNKESGRWRARLEEKHQEKVSVPEKSSLDWPFNLNHISPLIHPHGHFSLSGRWASPPLKAHLCASRWDGDGDACERTTSLSPSHRSAPLLAAGSPIGTAGHRRFIKGGCRPTAAKW